MGPGGTCVLRDRDHERTCGLLLAASELNTCSPATSTSDGGLESNYYFGLYSREAGFVIRPRGGGVGGSYLYNALACQNRGAPSQAASSVLLLFSWSGLESFPDPGALGQAEQTALPGF